MRNLHGWICCAIAALLLLCSGCENARTVEEAASPAQETPYVAETAQREEKQSEETVHPTPAVPPTAVPSNFSVPLESDRMVEDVTGEREGFLPAKVNFCDFVVTYWMRDITELSLHADGSFEGMTACWLGYGEDDSGNSIVETELAEFDGRFDEIRRLDNYTYAMRVAEIKLAREPGEVWYNGDAAERLYAVDFDGIQEGKRFLLYLPGTPTEEFSKDFLEELRAHWININPDGTLPCYVLCNPDTYFCVSGIPRTESEWGYFFPSDAQYLTAKDLEGITREDASIARNELYARYGYRFQSEEIRAYFSSKGWYTENPDVNAETFSAGDMTACERANLNLIIEYERKMGWRAEGGGKTAPSETETFADFLKGNVRATIGEDFENVQGYIGVTDYDLQENAFARMRSISFPELMELAEEATAPNYWSGITCYYAMTETLSGKKMLAVKFCPDGIPVDTDIVFIFGIYAGELRLTYAGSYTSAGKFNEEFYKNLVVEGDAVSGAGADVLSWCGYIDDTGHYRKVYELERLEYDCVTKRGWDGDTVWPGWNRNCGCTCWLLTSVDGDYYACETNENIHQEAFASFISFLESEEMQPTDRIDEIVVALRKDHGIGEKSWEENWRSWDTVAKTSEVIAEKVEPPLHPEGVEALLQEKLTELTKSTKIFEEWQEPEGDYYGIPLWDFTGIVCTAIRDFDSDGIPELLVCGKQDILFEYPVYEIRMNMYEVSGDNVVLADSMPFVAYQEEEEWDTIPVPLRSYPSFGGMTFRLNVFHTKEGCILLGEDYECGAFIDCSLSRNCWAIAYRNNKLQYVFSLTQTVEGCEVFQHTGYIFSDGELVSSDMVTALCDKYSWGREDEEGEDEADEGPEYTEKDFPTALQKLVSPYGIHVGDFDPGRAVLIPFDDTQREELWLYLPKSYDENGE